MKNLHQVKKIAFFSLLFCSITLAGCKKENITTTTDLPSAVTNNVPDSLLQLIKSLGMPIYTSNTPPNIDGIFLIEPLVFVSGNSGATTDIIGFRFADKKVKFTNQDNSKQQLFYQEKSFDYLSGAVIGISSIDSAFISGHDSLFSVFSFVNQYAININGDTTDQRKLVRIISGTKSTNAIRNTHTAAFTIKTIKNTTNAFLSQGKGRITKDQDGSSESVSFF